MPQKYNTDKLNLSGCLPDSSIIFSLSDDYIMPDKFVRTNSICPCFFSWKEASFTANILTPVFVKSVIYHKKIE